MNIKPALTIDEQINLLKIRGMQFQNEETARNFLLDNNYYRLNIYFHLMMGTGKNSFRKGTCFENIIIIYNFDAEIRSALLPSLEKAEITFRTRLAYYLAQNHSPDAFYDQSIYTDRNDY